VVAASSAGIDAEIRRFSSPPMFSGEDRQPGIAQGEGHRLWANRLDAGLDPAS